MKNKIYESNLLKVSDKQKIRSEAQLHTKGMVLAMILRPGSMQLIISYLCSHSCETENARCIFLLEGNETGV